MAGKNGREKSVVESVGDDYVCDCEEDISALERALHGDEMAVSNLHNRDSDVDLVVSEMRRVLADEFESVIRRRFGPNAEATVVLHVETSLTGPVSLVVALGGDNTLALSAQTLLSTIDAIAMTTHDAPMVLM